MDIKSRSIVDAPACMNSSQRRRPPDQASEQLYQPFSNLDSLRTILEVLSKGRLVGYCIP